MKMINFSGQRGVSLIEALVAMAVMAFGMLSIIGVQSTLRFNSDVAKQRSEAVRLAQRTIEDARSFTLIEAVAGSDYTDIVSSIGGISAYASSETNTNYTIDTAVIASGDTPDAETPRGKRLRVTVNWADRSSQNQSVQMDTVIAKVMPELGGTLALAANVGMNGVTQRGPSGHNVAIPLGVTDLGNGTSSFTPMGTDDRKAWLARSSVGARRYSALPSNGWASESIALPCSEARYVSRS